jgi:hypothetical protein
VVLLWLTQRVQDTQHWATGSPREACWLGRCPPHLIHSWLAAAGADSGCLQLWVQHRGPTCHSQEGQKAVCFVDAAAAGAVGCYPVSAVCRLC